MQWSRTVRDFSFFPILANYSVRDIVLAVFLSWVRVQVSAASDRVRTIHTHRLE
jgi:hypothetical protein